MEVAWVVMETLLPQYQFQIGVAEGLPVLEEGCFFMRHNGNYHQMLFQSSQKTLIGFEPIHDKFGKRSRERFFTSAQGFRVNAACTAASPTNNYT